MVGSRGPARQALVGAVDRQRRGGGVAGRQCSGKLSDLTPPCIVGAEEQVKSGCRCWCRWYSRRLSDTTAPREEARLGEKRR